MSKLNTILRSSAFVGTGAAALFLTACAGHSSSNRYGNVYDYESGGSCLPNACAPAQPVRYSQPEQVVYADCSVVQNMNCGAAPVYQAPAPVYQAPAPVQTYPTYTPAPAISYGGETAPCPVGTVASGDGTCAEQSYSAPATTYTAPTYSSSSSYSTSAGTADCPAGTTPAGDGTCMQSSYSAPTTSYGSSSYSSSAETAACPAGTTKAADGTCMQSSYGSTSYGSDTSYGSGSYNSSTSYGSSSYGGESAPCPAGSSKQSDGSCAMNEGTAISTGTTYGGYTNTGAYTTNDYMPIRK